MLLGDYFQPIKLLVVGLHLVNFDLELFGGLALNRVSARLHFHGQPVAFVAQGFQRHLGPGADAHLSRLAAQLVPSLKIHTQMILGVRRGAHHAENGPTIRQTLTAVSTA